MDLKETSIAASQAEYRFACFEYLNMHVFLHILHMHVIVIIWWSYAAAYNQSVNYIYKYAISQQLDWAFNKVLYIAGLLSVTGLNGVKRVIVITGIGCVSYCN